MTTNWNYQPLTLQQRQLMNDILPQCGNNPTVAEILVRRGVRTPQEASSFFAPSVNDFHDPFLMQDMDKAVNRLTKAMGAKERIMVYGDYAVDGTT
ncbi:MAG: single-stranded-DNA-specific exonuclease RecJ, partial [Muribaculaceae bacterium]|nr:single-stranded-DNA-specific exonuclease RecJ [Muribaculaceae bacterium]